MIMNNSKISALLNNVNMRAVIIGIAAIICTSMLCVAALRIGLSDRAVTVTGLGEIEQTSDWIVWTGAIESQSTSRAECYRKVEADCAAVAAYIKKQGIADDAYSVSAIMISEDYDDNYTADGRYAGRRFKGYRARQNFTVKSAEVDKVEALSRDVMSLIPQGINIESGMPQYYIRNLQELKLSLIDAATANAMLRAEKLVKGFARIKDIKSIDIGVFQITGLYGNDEYTYGGADNTMDKVKKVSITVHATYGIR